MIDQRLLLAFSAAGHAASVSVSDMLLPDVCSFGWGHTDPLKSW